MPARSKDVSIYLSRTYVITPNAKTASAFFNFYWLCFDASEI